MMKHLEAYMVALATLQIAAASVPSADQLRIVLRRMRTSIRGRSGPTLKPTELLSARAKLLGRTGPRRDMNGHEWCSGGMASG